jgi:phosphate transport system protein
VELALQAPVADDLRLLLPVLRVVPELERSHHLVVHLAEHDASVLSDEVSARCGGLVQQMGETAAGMWNQVADAWCQRDRAAAGALAHRNVDLDNLHAALMGELASGGMSLPVTMDMTLVARFYQILGDHAVKIARRVADLAGRPHPN